MGNEADEATSTGDTEAPHSDGDLGDLLQELRVLLQGVQVLTGFLIILPFNPVFRDLPGSARGVYLVMFLCVLVSLVLFSAPAAQHRLLTPLSNRVRFKQFATRLIVIGLVPFSASLVLATHFVVSEVADSRAALVTASVVCAIILVLWWLLPWHMRDRHSSQQRDR